MAPRGSWVLIGDSLSGRELPGGVCAAAWIIVRHAWCKRAGCTEHTVGEGVGQELESPHSGPAAPQTCWVASGRSHALSYPQADEEGLADPSDVSEDPGCLCLHITTCITGKLRKTFIGFWEAEEDLLRREHLLGVLRDEQEFTSWRKEGCSSLREEPRQTCRGIKGPGKPRRSQTS